jgi:MscS family membrane protein
MAVIVESLNISTSPYVNALISLVFFVFLAKLADLLVDKGLRRFAKFTSSDLDDRIIDVVHRPVYFSIMLVGLALAVRYLAPQGKVLFYSDNLIYTVICLLWMAASFKAARAVLEHSIDRVSDVTGLGKDILPLVENVASVVLALIFLMAALSIWHVNITPLLASAGIAGVALAVAAKDMLSNFFGGLSIFMDKPYKKGDFVVLDKGERGEVVAIGLRSTKIKTLDDSLITIPNSLISASKIVNESAPAPNLRLRVPVSVAYGSDIDRVEELLTGCAKENEKIVREPAPLARFKSFGESALNYELLCWAKEPALKEVAVHELNRAVYKAFAKEGILIPYPQRDIHIKEMPGRVRARQISEGKGEEIF